MSKELEVIIMEFEMKMDAIIRRLSVAELQVKPKVNERLEDDNN